MRTEGDAGSEALKQKLAGRDLTLLFEPGRAIVANAGVLLTRVEYLKPGETRNFALIDAGMNDMLRPSLYGAWLMSCCTRCGPMSRPSPTAAAISPRWSARIRSARTMT